MPRLSPNGGVRGFQKSFRKRFRKKFQKKSFRKESDNTQKIISVTAGLPKLFVRESQQKYKDLYGIPDKRLEKITLQKNYQKKSLTLAANVDCFLPVCF